MAGEYEGLSNERVQRVTRRKLDPWDRVKFLLLMAIVGGIAIATNVNPPFTPFSTAAADFLAQPFGSILLALFGLEVVRQLHYLLSERWSGYHRFWSHGVFGGVERSAERFKPWTRFRIGRFFRRIFLILLLAVLVDLLVPTVSSPIDAIVQAPQLLVQALPFVIQIIVVLTITIGQFVALFWFLSRGGMDVVLPEEIKTRFKDVWGQDHVLDLIRENISFLERPDEIEAKGGYIPGGILLWGPPGTGKTLLAEAMAGETGKPYVFVEPGAFINMFLGVGILKVKGLYRRLRKLSLRHGGVIVFFDEADALGSRGALAGPAGGPFGQFSAEAVRACNGVHYSHPSVIGLLDQATTAPESTRADEEHHRRFPKIVMGGMGGGGMGTLQALLTEMNGLTKPRGLGNRLRKMLGMRPKLPPKYRILHVMATNMPNALDEAMLRPGRIDRIFKMGYPSKEGRRVTLNGYLAKVSHNLSEDQVEELATVTPYYTGAKIKDLVNEALILAIRDGRDTIEWDDIWRAKSLKELGPPEDAEYIERERHAVAVHEACHAVIAHLMLNHKKIDLATIERRGAVGGMVKPISMEDRFTLWKSEYEAEVMTFLASLAGERMFFEADNSAGVSSDLRAATQIVASMEGVYGMGEGITSWLGLPQNSAWQTPDPTEKVVGRMADRVEKRLKELYDRTWDLLDQHRDEVLTIAHALEQRKTISGDDIAEIMGSDPGSQVSREPKGWNVIDVEMATRRKVEALSRTSGERGEADDDDSPPNGHHPEAD